ncbi:MAG: hypothetical protein DWI30_06055 [Chloroflexi bacterium]|nr:MAG: hypothetical protein DWI30_06055 [Chloroflexota bacterium]
MITIQHIYQQAKPRLWYWYTLVAFLFLLTTLFTSHNPDWHLDIGVSSTRSFGSTLADSEFTRFFGGTVWYRQIPKGSDIGVPDSITPQIIKVRIIMRYEEAPADIVLQSERLKFALTHAGQYRTYWIYTPPDQHFVMNCDTQRVTVPYLSKYCAALVDIRGTTPLNAANLSRLAIILPLIAWMLVIIVSIWRLVRRSDAAIAIVSVAALLAYYVVQTYPLQIITWRIPLTIFLVGCSVIVWFVTQPRFKYGWLLGIFVLAVALRILAYSAPGADGVDRKVHARQLESVIYGNIYLENIGTIVRGGDIGANQQVYPYPPAVYLLLSPIMLLVSPVMTFNFYVGLAALLIDASLVFFLVWMIIQQGLGQRVAIYSALALLWFPQAYVMHSYPVVAQDLAQWASWCFAFLAIIYYGNPHMRNQIVQLLFAGIAITGHFGAFITMTIMQVWQFLLGTMRPAAWRWLGLSAVFGIVYYSQYIVLIWAQMGRLVHASTGTRLAGFLDLWNNGINDHYSWVVFCVALLSLGLPVLRQRPALSKTLWAGFAASGLLAVLRVVFYANPTRLVIFLAPLIALGIGMLAPRYTNHRAGRWLIYTLFAYLAYSALTAWLSITIDQQLVRWILPQ